MHTYIRCVKFTAFIKSNDLAGKLLKGQLHYILAQLQIEQYKVIILLTETW